MKPVETYRSSIGPLISRYLIVKRALGRHGDTTAYILQRLDRFLISCRMPDLTCETFTAWAESMACLQTNTRRARLRTVYHFCLFRQREHPHSFVPDPTQFPLPGPRHLPYIFSEADIVRLLAVTEDLSPHTVSPLRREVARLAIVILYTAGLRRGELVRLTLNDYDQTARVLLVRRTKFDKSRLVPLSVDATMEVERYLTARRQVGALSDGDAPLLVNHQGGQLRGYTGAGFGSLLRKVIRAAGIRTAEGRSPRIHDLRFTFAVHALWRWYRAGVDVQNRLPALATYLGHVSVVSTQYYLTFLMATAEAASQRFHAHSSTWLLGGSLEGGHR